MLITKNRDHGSPYDRGSADAYYRRPHNPHYYLMKDTMFSERIERNEMTEDQIAEYSAGYNEEDDRKDW